MKLVDHATFMTLPTGTVYQEYSPHTLGELCIKACDGLNNSFLEANLTPDCKAEDGFTIETPGGFGRWGSYNKSAQFLVYESADRARLADWLLNPNAAVDAMNADPVVRLTVTL